ncbi:MAG: hypothetical protein GY845_15210 [Planctomycetes bacterium]|nr:hypothetical protein [Planctomycetota bacterium]
MSGKKEENALWRSFTCDDYDTHHSETFADRVRMMKTSISDKLYRFSGDAEVCQKLGFYRVRMDF